MRILFIDIDTLRPDHLGCYGYHRNTSPNLDWIASQGRRFDNCYVSDAPCLPSRAALWSGRCGFHNGAINHGGVAADPFHEGPGRMFRDRMEATGWIPQLRKAGLYPVTVSPFGERHSAWWWYAGWREAYNPGKGGGEVADDITSLALNWIENNAQKDNWFLHVNYWDPHTPYRTPPEYGNPFASDPLPAWLTEEVRQRCWEGFGPHSAREPHGDLDGLWATTHFPRMPLQIDSMEAVRKWIDGYDTGVWYADRHVGLLLEELRRQGVLDDLVIIVSSDHGENLGELNVWGDHHHADHITSRVPLIIRWPGVTTPGSTDGALHYHFDWAATMIELLGGQVPDNWDGVPFTAALCAGRDTPGAPAGVEGRDALVVSQAAWSCMRSVRFQHAGEDYICLRTFHDGYKDLEPVMLFNLTEDPHEQHDLAPSQPELVNLAMGKLADWQQAQMLTHTADVDPMMTVLREGGPFHTRGTLPDYLAHLRATGRSAAAERLERLHPEEAHAGK